MEKERFWLKSDVFGITFIIAFVLLLLALILFLTKPEIGYATLIFNVGFFAITIITFYLYLNKKGVSLEEFVFKGISFKSILLCILLIIFVTITGAGLSKIWSDLFKIGQENANILDEFKSDKLWLNIINLKLVIQILVPFAEELIFRGLIFRFLRQKKSFIFSAIISSLIFSLIHFNLASIPLTFLLGLTTAYIFEKKKSIFYPFLVHMGVNAFVADIVLFSMFK